MTTAQSTWSPLQTVQQRLACAAPFSFFFDVVQTHWKAHDPVALHRICTLARKQGATHIAVESANSRPGVGQDVDELDARFGGGGAAECVAISFFVGGDENTLIADLPADALIGQLTLVNYREPGSVTFSVSYIYEAILRPPSLPGSPGQLLNNYLCVGGTFSVSVLARQFDLPGVYYCQQNSQTHVCAHASLRMALNGLSASTTTAISNSAINRHLGVTPPCQGLQLGQVVSVIQDLGGMVEEVVDCSKLDSADYMKILASIVESGDRALLVFTTAGSEEHVVCVYGHTRNSDEWHPQAIPAYAGPQSAPFYSSSMWIDHFLIHDDNFGPYYTLSSRALETNKQVAAHWIIAIRARAANIGADLAETLASVYLANTLPTLAPLAPAGTRWLSYITQQQHTYVLRAVLLERQAYIDHLSQSQCHDGSRTSATDVQLLATLPEYFWMVEFSLPALYTGNRSKLGEVLIVPNRPAPPFGPNDLILAIRGPAMMVTKDPQGNFALYGFGLTAHSPVFRPNSPRYEW